MLAFGLCPSLKQINFTYLDCFYKQIPISAPISPCLVFHDFRSLVNCGTVCWTVREVSQSQCLAYGVAVQSRHWDEKGVREMQSSARLQSLVKKYPEKSAKLGFTAWHYLHAVQSPLYLWAQVSEGTYQSLSASIQTGTVSNHQHENTKDFESLL